MRARLHALAPLADPPAPARPLPERLVLAAFPSAVAQAGCAAARPEGVGLFIHADAANVTLPPAPPPWLTLDGPHGEGPRLCRVDCRSQDNPRGERTADLVFRVGGRRYVMCFVQQSGLLVQTQMVLVLDTPLTVDMLVAVTYVAGVIKDIPLPPLKLVVTVLAVLALLALGLIAALLRHLFAVVPVPRPLSVDTLGQPIVVFPGFAVQEGLPLKTVAAEDQTIALQTVKSIYWLLRQVE